MATITPLDTKVSALLVEGAAIAFTEPERAKNLLSQAAESLSGDLRDEANIWLACCYWAVGEKAEARAVLESVRPESVECKFLWGITMASMVTVPEALDCLERVRPYFDRIEDEQRKGKFCNQHAVALRRSNDFDGAILAYTEARFWFQQAGSPEFSAAAANNLADLLAKVGQQEEAHRYADEAIAEYRRLGVDVYLGQALDTKARIYLDEKKNADAAILAAQSVKLLEQGEQKELTARSLITEATALSRAGNYLKAFCRLDEARRIAEYLGNSDLLFDVQWEMRELSKLLRNSTEQSLISIALKEGSIRSAAKKMRIYHHALGELMKKHGLTLPNN